MRRAARTTLLLVCSCIAGIGAGELLHRTSWSRDVVGRLLGRGQFVAEVGGTSYFAADLERDDLATSVFATRLRQSPSPRAAPPDAVERELVLLQNQFGDPNGFRAALAQSGADESSLRDSITDHLEVRQAIENVIASKPTASDAECRAVYNSNPAHFAQPKRYRARHLFVAAPNGSTAEVIAAKQSIAQGLGVRLLAGEAFEDLASEASEDEATRMRGGDLGYFSAARAPAEFIAELEKLAPGQTSAPFHSRLGFHIVQLTDVKPQNALSFQQVRAEIALRLSNDKRTAAVAQLLADMKASAVAPTAPEGD